MFFKKSANRPPQEQAEKPVVEKEMSTQVEPTAPADSPLEKLQPTKNDKPIEKKEKQKDSDTMTPRYHDTTVSRYHDTMSPRYNDAIVGLVRKAVKEFGKEAATHKLTEIEKKEIADLIYTYKNRGVKTSENEITRISVNFVLEDYRENGENSILHKILEALNE